MANLRPDSPEGTTEVVRRAEAALAEVRQRLLAEDTLELREIAAIAQRHNVEPGNLIHALEHSSECYVDWPSERVVCR